MVKSRILSVSALLNLLNIWVITVLGVLCILPIIHVLMISLSGKEAAAAHLVGLWPVNFTLAAYRESVGSPEFLRAFNITLERIILGTAVNMVLTVLMAYPLSKDSRRFPYRNVYVWIMVFTMLFNGGLIPNYVLIHRLGLMNSIWALILPMAVPVFNIVLLLNFFRQLPKEIEESAFVDGANPFTTLLRIFVPLSLPALATLTLFSLVGHWNAWFDGLIYMNDVRKFPMQTYLEVLLEHSRVTSFEEAKLNLDYSNRTLYTAQIFLAMLPVLMVYPFLQKYFAKGIVLGAVKE